MPASPATPGLRSGLSAPLRDQGCRPGSSTGSERGRDRQAGPTTNHGVRRPDGCFKHRPAGATTEGTTIRPFHIDIPDAQVDDLRPARQRDMGQRLRLAQGRGKGNALPQFVTEIDGVDIQFAHVRSKHEDALPLLMTHGWPSSIFELLKVVGPLTDPTAHGGSAEDAGAGRTARYPPQHARDRAAEYREASPRARTGALGVLRRGEDRVRAARCLLHEGLRLRSDHEHAAADHRLRAGGFARRPLCLLLRQFAVWTDSGGEPERSLTRDEMLDDVSLYWFTNTGTSSSRSYCLGAARALCQRGNVVLVDFWTYTCINWLRMLPYIRAWPGSTEIGDWW